MLTIRRPSVVGDMLEAFRREDIMERKIVIKVDEEMGQDYNGVFRDILTAFWGGVFGQCFEGELEAAPIVSCQATREDWEAMGRILFKGFEQVHYFPLRFSQASLVYGVLGRDHVTQEVLQNSFIRSLGDNEGAVLRDALTASEFSSEMVEDLVEVLGRCGVRQLPTPANCPGLIHRSAELIFMERAQFPIDGLKLQRLSQFEEFQSVERIKALYQKMMPTSRKVANSLQADITHELQQVHFDYLRRAVRSFDKAMTLKFLRFVSGSDSMNFQVIKINFVDLYGAQRRFISHTCTVTLDIPVTYESYNEFATELKNQLDSNFWDITFA